MDKAHILEHLKSINYPGFSRDIVSFGMVKDVTIAGESVTVHLNITSQNEDKKQEVIAAVRKELAGHFSTVNVELTADAPQQSAPVQQQQQQAPAPILENVQHIIAVAS